MHYLFLNSTSVISSGLLTLSQEYSKNDLYKKTNKPSSCKEVLVCTMYYYQIINNSKTRGSGLQGQGAACMHILKLTRPL